MDSGIEAMEVVGQFRRHSATLVTSIWFRLYIGIGLFALTAVTIVVSGRIMAGRREMPDPFLAVSDLFNGDARQVALARGFTCQNPDYSATLTDFCTQLNPDQRYSGIYLRISGSMAKEVDLWLRKNRLRLGDLVLLWGKPETRPYCQTLVISWSTPRFMAMVAVSRTRLINYFAPILSISFLHKGLPRWEEPLLNDVLHGCGSD
jgi:hypothetical protein